MTGYNLNIMLDQVIQDILDAPARLSKDQLYEAGCERVERFIHVNKLPSVGVGATHRSRWHVDACAYYRPGIIRICVSKCAHPAADTPRGRDWSWPGYCIDREPYGVVAHELGHHVDVTLSHIKYSYSGNFSREVFTAAEEPGISGYATGACEWFAEALRLFVTNHALLREMRPRTHALLMARLEPVSGEDWEKELSRLMPCPRRVINAARRKIKQ